VVPRCYSATGASHGTYPAGVTGGAGIAVTGAASLVNSTISGNVLYESLPRSDAALTLIPSRGAAVLAGTLHLDHATTSITGDNISAASLNVAELTIHRSVVIAPAGQSACGPSVSDANSSCNWIVLRPALSPLRPCRPSLPLT
jgi:hypothetical protein